MRLSVIVGLFAFRAATHGELLICGYHGIRCYDEKTGAFVRTLAHSGEEQEGVTFGANGELFGVVNNLGGGSIMRFVPGLNGAPEILAAHAGWMPMGLARSQNDDFFVASSGWENPSGGVVRVSADGTTATDFVERGAGGLRLPFDLLFSPEGDLLVSELREPLGVLRFDGHTGALLGQFVAPGRGGLLNSSGLTFGPDGNLYVGSPATDSVLRFDGRTGPLIDEFVAPNSGGLQAPRGLRFGPDGRLYVCSAGTTAVLRYNGTTGAFVDEFISPGSGGLDNAPHFIAFSPRENGLRISLSSNGPHLSCSGLPTAAVVESATNVAGPWSVFAQTTEAESKMTAQTPSAQMGFFRISAP